jgi:hypothetical protein
MLNEKLENLKLQQQKRRRAQKKAKRLDRVSSTQQNSSYSVERKKALEDFLVVREVLQLAQEQNMTARMANDPIRTATNKPLSAEQKLLLVIFSTAGTVHENAEFSEAFILQTFVLTRLQLKSSESRSLRIFTGVSELKALDGSLSSWKDLADYVDRIKSQKFIRDLTETFKEKPTKHKIPQIHVERLQDSLSHLFVQINELESVLKFEPNLKNNDPTFLQWLVFDITVTAGLAAYHAYNVMRTVIAAMGVTGSVATITIGWEIAAVLGVITLGLSLFNQLSDYTEYQQNFDTNRRAYRDNFSALGAKASIFIEYSLDIADVLSALGGVTHFGYNVLEKKGVIKKLPKGIRNPIKKGIKPFFAAMSPTLASDVEKQLSKNLKNKLLALTKNKGNRKGRNWKHSYINRYFDSFNTLMSTSKLGLDFAALAVRGYFEIYPAYIDYVKNGKDFDFSKALIHLTASGVLLAGMAKPSLPKTNSFRTARAAASVLGKVSKTKSKWNKEEF